jgi:hypothetical protein
VVVERVAGATEERRARDVERAPEDRALSAAAETELRDEVREAREETVPEGADRAGARADPREETPEAARPTLRGGAERDDDRLALAGVEGGDSTADPTRAVDPVERPGFPPRFEARAPSARRKTATRTSVHLVHRAFIAGLLPSFAREQFRDAAHCGRNRRSESPRKALAGRQVVGSGLIDYEE